MTSRTRALDSYQRLHVDTRPQWRAWLIEHYSTSIGVWLVTWKKGRGPYVAYDEIVDEAVCFGWVDSLPRTLDADRSQRLVTPRKPGSNWSRVNKVRAERLIAAGLMHAAGLAVIEAARQDGSWSRLDHVEELIEPEDLRAALDGAPIARTWWDGFPRSTRRAILEWIGNAKTAETRTQRITRTVEEAAIGKRANQWRQPTRSI